MNNQEFIPMGDLDPNRVVVYVKHVPDQDNPEMSTIHRQIGYLDSDSGFHTHIGYNKFTREAYPVPSKSDGWELTTDRLMDDIRNDTSLTFSGKIRKLSEEYEWHIKWIKNHICDPTAKIFSPVSPNPIERDINTGWVEYNTLDNGGIGFIVLVNSELKVKVYGHTEGVVLEAYRLDDIAIYDRIIYEGYPKKIFFGKSLMNAMTTFSGGHGDKWDGNSILLDFGDNKYTHIGAKIFSFTTCEPVIKYVSSVGNNGVPYPYAETENWCYCMLSGMQTPVSEHPNREKNGDIYDYVDKTYEKYDRKMINEGNNDIKFEIVSDPTSNTKCVQFTENVKVQLVPGTCV